MLANLFPPWVVAHSADPAALAAVFAPYDVERAAVARAVAKRQTEYFAVRHLARQALAELGVAPQPLLNRPDRSPIWPEGVVGSLSHTDGWCGVVVARQEPRCAGLGIDAEGSYDMSEGVIERVLTACELAALEGLPDGQRQARATLVFSAKEALYKCIYPHVLRFVGFGEVEIFADFAHDTGSFEVRFTDADLLAPLFPQGYQLVGCFARDSKRWLTGVLLSTA